MYGYCSCFPYPHRIHIMYINYLPTYIYIFIKRLKMQNSAFLRRGKFLRHVSSRSFLFRSDLFCHFFLANVVIRLIVGF